MVCLAYGYTEDGDLLVAGGDLSPAGKIHITELAGKMMDKDGEIGQVSWYTFSGLGYSSSKGDRISIFGNRQRRHLQTRPLPAMETMARKTLT